MVWPIGKPRKGMQYAPSKSTHKTCTKCGESKPRDAEHYAFNSRGYPQSRCLACRCPSGVSMQQRSELAKAKTKTNTNTKKPKPLTPRPYHQKIQLRTATEFKTRQACVCACCKGKFMSSGNSTYGIYCSKECSRIYGSQSSYMDFLGLVDFSGG